MLTEQVQRRERLKLERTKRQKEYLDMILFPIEHLARPILDQLIEIDANDFFMNPVTSEEAPDYASIIDKPMYFSKIQSKLNAHEYTRLDEFKADVELIWENCMTYNTPSSKYYRVACKLKKTANELFEVADKKMESYDLDNGILNAPIDESIFDYEAGDEAEIRIEGTLADISATVPVRSRPRSQLPMITATTTKELEDMARKVPSRRSGRGRTKNVETENYTIRESMTQDEADIVRPTVPSQGLDKGIQTDTYLLLSLLKQFQSAEEIQKLEAQMDEDKNKQDTAPEVEPSAPTVVEAEPAVIAKAQNVPSMPQEDKKEDTVTDNLSLQYITEGKEQQTPQDIVKDKPAEPALEVIDVIGTDIPDHPQQTHKELEDRSISKPAEVHPMHKHPTDSTSSLYQQQQQQEQQQQEQQEQQQQQQQQQNKKRPRRSLSTAVPVRATRSRGLESTVEELKNRKRMSHEARELFASVLHLEKQVEKAKPYSSKPAAVGWAYLESDDEEGHKSGEEQVEETIEPIKKSSKKRKIEPVSLDEFERGQIVWARVSGYPSHPAKVKKKK